MSPPAPVRYRRLWGGALERRVRFRQGAVMTARHLLRWPVRTGGGVLGVAFAVAVLAIISTHLPAALRTFLLTLAVVDDLVAVTIIAVVYTSELHLLALAGALLAYRLPPFIALNEPEASLHPDLMAPLAELVVQASARSQVWLVTHSTALAEAIAASRAGKVRTVEKRDGATWIEGLTRWGEFADDEEDDE